MVEISVVPGKKVDYSKHIGLDSIYSPKPVVPIEDKVVILLREVSRSLKIPNYTVSYSYNTTLTTKQITDLYLEHGTYAVSLSIDAEGGGFDLQINDSSYLIKGLKGTVVMDEIITKVSVTGYGNAGTAKIRLNLVK